MDVRKGSNIRAGLQVDWEDRQWPWEEVRQDWNEGEHFQLDQRLVVRWEEGGIYSNGTVIYITLNN